jgi:predicted SpoU family rRNA methylase
MTPVIAADNQVHAETEWLDCVLNRYLKGTLHTSFTLARDKIETGAISMSPIVFEEHAVKRVIVRKLPVDAICQIAQFGVTVQQTHDRVMKRGEINGKPVHVVLVGPNVVKTFYEANEWESTITVRRKSHVVAM